MGQSTAIEWTDATWNPTRGCSRISEGCRNCYAEAIAARFSRSDMGPAEYTARSEANDLPPFFGFAQRTEAGPRWTGKVELIWDKLAEPQHWREPKRIFVNSMSDLFHEHLSDTDIAHVFKTMYHENHHTYPGPAQQQRRGLGRMAEGFARPGISRGQANWGIPSPRSRKL